MADLAIVNGTVFTPAGPVCGGLAVTDGRITHVGSDD